MFGAEPVSFVVDGETRWYVGLIDYCRLERRVEELEFAAKSPPGGESVGPFKTPQQMFEDDMRRLAASNPKVSNEKALALGHAHQSCPLGIANQNA